MPFADKFRAMLDLPFPGDALGAPPNTFVVESVSVGHEGRAPGQYAYPLRLVLVGRERPSGPGGLAAVKRAIKPLFSRRCTTFSGFGTPYQLWFGRPAIESLGDNCYAVTAEGAGARVHLQDDLARFCDYLAEEGQIVVTPEQRDALVADYIARYQAEVARLVGRYRTRIRRAEALRPNVETS
jgi:hypothetical protein